MVKLGYKLLELINNYFKSPYFYRDIATNRELLKSVLEAAGSIHKPLLGRHIPNLLKLLGNNHKNHSHS